MPRLAVKGVDKQFGDDTELVIHADSESNARLKADLKGVVVISVDTALVALAYLIKQIERMAHLQRGVIKCLHWLPNTGSFCCSRRSIASTRRSRAIALVAAARGVKVR